MSSEQDYTYGVEFTPKQIAAKNTPLKVDELESEGISFVRVLWVDPNNVVRYRVIPLAHFQNLLKSPRPGVTTVQVALGLVALTMSPGFASSGEYLYAFDISSLRRCPDAPGHAWIFGFFQEKVPKQVNNLPSVEVGLCPRGTLSRIQNAAKNDYGISFLVGFETEFTLLTSRSPITTVHQLEAWSTSRAMTEHPSVQPVLDDIAKALAESKIALQMYHAEGAPSQYEIVTGPLEPLEAADALVLTREIVYNTARKHGLYASLAPRLFVTSAGSSAHAHISIHSDSPSPKHNEFPMSTLESHFLAGLLAHLRDVVPLTLPFPASFGRMADGAWSGGTYVSWGADSRETPIRLCNSTSSSGNRKNFEFRALDGTANPHFALAAILGAGIQGVKEKTKLTVRDCSGPVDVASMKEEDRHALGVKERLPLSWTEARNCLKESRLMNELLGEETVTLWMNVNKRMAEVLDQPETEEKKLELLVKYY